MTQMYSGYEIFIDDPAILTPEDLTIYYYGNDSEYLIHVLSAHYYAQIISDPLAKLDVLSTVLATVAQYILVYSGQPGWNLVWHLYRELNTFDQNRTALILAHPNSAAEITSFFARLENRINGMKYSS